MISTDTDEIQKIEKTEIVIFAARSTTHYILDIVPNESMNLSFGIRKARLLVEFEQQLGTFVEAWDEMTEQFESKWRPLQLMDQHNIVDGEPETGTYKGTPLICFEPARGFQSGFTLSHYKASLVEQKHAAIDTYLQVVDVYGDPENDLDDTPEGIVIDEFGHLNGPSLGERIANVAEEEETEGTEESLSASEIPF